MENVLDPEVVAKFKATGPGYLIAYKRVAASGEDLR